MKPAKPNPHSRLPKAIAHTLGASLDDFAGGTEQRLKVTGAWWAGWRSGKAVKKFTPLNRSRSDTAAATSTSPLSTAATAEDGGYLGRGQLRLRDYEIVMGWQVGADDQAVRTKGTFYLVIHPHGHQIHGALDRSQPRRAYGQRLVSQRPHARGHTTTPRQTQRQHP